MIRKKKFENFNILISKNKKYFLFIKKQKLITIIFGNFMSFLRYLYIDKK